GRHGGGRRTRPVPLSGPTTIPQARWSGSHAARLRRSRSAGLCPSHIGSETHTGGDHRMKTPTLPNGLLAAEGARLLGEIITWSCGGLTVRHLDLVGALRSSGLEEGVARELAPRHAFSRACKKLAQARIIRQLREDKDALTFQFTAERREDGVYSYDFETLLTLDKAKGKVSCPLAGLATLAQEELSRNAVYECGRQAP